jgi:uncharacterized protein (TIGR02271 family)
MRSKKASTVVAVFRDAGKAREAVRALREAGFTDAHIGVVSPHQEDKKASKGSKIATGAAVGAGTIGGVAALWSLGISLGMLPVIGPILAAGPLAAALISGAAGAAAGGLVGALTGLGLEEKDAKYYEGEVHAGRTLVTVQANGRNGEAWTILQRFGGYNRETAETSSREEGGEQTIEVREEKARARKTPVKTGEVRVRKEVQTEMETLQVPVEREEIVIKRRPASRRTSTSGPRERDEIRIPVKEEKVTVSKEEVVKEEVTVGKRKVRGTKQVTVPVRKERIKVEKQGDVDVQSELGSSRSRG